MLMMMMMMMMMKGHYDERILNMCSCAKTNTVDSCSAVERKIQSALCSTSVMRQGAFSLPVLHDWLEIEEPCEH
ncbi:hypothetical protein INR49_014575 [Caranx melampygus]|nr:hypothetical protein INR49_014575 [Caranx melampygus]